MDDLPKLPGTLVVDDGEHALPSPRARDMVVQYHCNTEMPVVESQISQALKRDLPRFFGTDVVQGLDNDGNPCWRVKWATYPIAIIAGGPTLKQTISKAKTFKTVMVAGSAHDYVLDHGIVPDYCVLIDAIPEAVDWLKHPQKTTTYLLASQNHPVMFEHLRDYKVHIWNAMGPKHSFNDEPSVGGGGTAALRCIELALLLGYRDQHFFGLDSCYLDDGTTHAYDDWKPPDPANVTLDNGVRVTKFKSDLGMLGQAEVFMATFAARKAVMRATIHGDNLIAELARADNGNEGVRLAC